jgi:hypothetical protein
MPFQSVVRLDTAFGVPGEFYSDGPKRAEPGTIRSATPANNIFGRGFSLDSALPGVWRSGDPAANGERYGILVSPKEHASYGTAAGGPLAPTITLPNEVTAQIATMGQIIVQARDAANLVGNIVRIVKATGEIVTVPPGTAADPLMVDLPNAVVVRVPQPAALGLVVIQLSTQ